MLTKFILIACFIVLGAQSMAAEDNADKIVSLLSSKLSTTFINTYKSKADKPKVFIGRIQNSVKGLDEGDIKEIVNGFETAITNSVIVVDREQTEVINSEQSLQQSGEVADQDVQALGNKYGASKIIFLDFTDKITPKDENVENVKISAKLTVIDVKTQRKEVNKLIAVGFTHKFFKQAYPVRETIAWTFFSVSAVTLGMTLNYDSIYWDQHAKYENADNEDDATKYRNSSHAAREKEKTFGAISAVAVTIGCLFYPFKRDDTLYHKYELSIVPLTRGVGLGVAWNH